MLSLLNASTTATSLMTEIISILVSGITDIATGVGTGLSSLISSIFLGAEGGLSEFGQIIIIFAGISLAIGLCRWVLNFVTSLGARNR